MKKKSILDFFKIDSKYEIAITSFVLAFFVCFVSYSAFIVYGFNSPDGLLEGFHFYINRHWAIAGCGRWFLALIDMAHANLVFPFLTVVECFIINWLSSFTLGKILKINNKFCICLLCIVFSVLPPFVEILLYTNSACSYSLSVLLSILFVYFNLKEENIYIIISALCLGCAMGSYQSQVGIAIGLTVISIILQLIENKENIFLFLLKSLISGIGAIIIYIVGLNICLSYFNLELSSRAASFSLAEIFKQLPAKFINSYVDFFNLFNQATLKRHIIFALMFIVLIVELINISVIYIKEKKYSKMLTIIVLSLLLPVSFNIIEIILPNFEMALLMTTPNYLILFFVITLLNYMPLRPKQIITLFISVIILSLSWTYVLSANATYDSYRLSYNSYKEQFSQALNRVFELDGYELNQTNIVVIGYPSDKELRENVNIYNYVNNLHSNLLYWQAENLDVNSTYQYLLNEFGVNSGEVGYEEYKALLLLDDIKEMPIWPKSGSVKLVNNYAVIKFGEPNE